MTELVPTLIENHFCILVLTLMGMMNLVLDFDDLIFFDLGSDGGLDDGFVSGMNLFLILAWVMGLFPVRLTSMVNKANAKYVSQRPRKGLETFRKNWKSRFPHFDSKTIRNTSLINGF